MLAGNLDGCLAIANRLIERPADSTWQLPGWRLSRCLAPGGRAGSAGYGFRRM
jgi:hypothetical protein